MSYTPQQLRDEAENEMEYFPWSGPQARAAKDRAHAAALEELAAANRQLDDCEHGYATLKADLAAANAEREKLIGALEMMWDQYENGTQCYEDPDEHAGYLGHAVNLSADEEQRVLALIPDQCSAAIDAAIAARKEKS